MIISGIETVYFCTYYSTGRTPAQLHCTKVGPMEGPLLESVMDITQAYHRQGDVYRLDHDGQPVLLWSHRGGYTKPEYDPQYAEYLQLKAKYADVDTETETV